MTRDVVGRGLGDDKAPSRKRWALILAGGDGTRLLRLTRLISGDDRAKQFCQLVGNETLLEQTRKRAERSIQWEQTLVQLTTAHKDLYLQEHGIRPSQRIIQPSNRGTAPPILNGLLSIEQHDRDAIVAILPCDHFYANESAFTAALESAFDAAAEYSRSVILLGAPPQCAEMEYGWIELGPPAGGALFRVQGFWEKPTFNVARELLERGSLWNTFVMVGRVQAFLDMADIVLPAVVEVLRRGPLWTGGELSIPHSLYDRIGSVDFSRQVLAMQNKRLLTLPMSDAGWNDMGHPERAVAVLQAEGFAPLWMKQWEAAKRLPAMAAAARVGIE
jgi:mannose-1-phosphate guanylyltransferase